MNSKHDSQNTEWIVNLPDQQPTDKVECRLYRYGTETNGYGYLYELRDSGDLGKVLYSEKENPLTRPSHRKEIDDFFQSGVVSQDKYKTLYAGDADEPEMHALYTALWQKAKDLGYSEGDPIVIKTNEGSPHCDIRPKNGTGRHVSINFSEPDVHETALDLGEHGPFVSVVWNKVTNQISPAYRESNFRDYR